MMQAATPTCPVKPLSHMQSRNRASASKQTGIALFIMLMLLIIMSLLMAWTVKSVTFETKITAYQAFKDQAMNRADNALISMENCITGATQPSTSPNGVEVCIKDGTELNANTVFNGSLAGFLDRTLNPFRSATGYWVGYFTSTGINNNSHTWSDESSFTTVGVVGLSNTQQPRVAVERLNAVNLSGFSQDSASQGFQLGRATPFRVTANSSDSGAAVQGVNAIAQSMVYVPAAAITTPE